MNSRTAKYLRKNGNGEQLIRDSEEALAYWEKQEQIKPCEINRFNIEYLKGFIDYIKQNLSGTTVQ